MSIARHTGYNLAAAVVPIALTLVTVPLYLRLIGLERYGVLALCWALLGLVGFVSLGLGPSVNRQLALRAEASAVERSAVFWTGTWLSLALAALAFPLLLLLARLYLPTLAGEASHVAGELPAAAPWIAAVFASSLVSGVFTGALQGRQLFGPLSLINVVTASLIALLPLAAAWALGPALSHLLAATFLANAIGAALLLLTCRSGVPIHRAQAPDRRLISPLFGYGSWITVIAAIAPLVMLADRFIIAELQGVAAVSVYVIAYNLVSRLTLVASSFHAAALPRFAAAAQAEEARLASLSLRALLAVLTPLTVAAAAILPHFFLLWLGSATGSEAAPVAIILLLGMFLHGIGHIPSTILMGRGKPAVIAWLLILYVLPYLLLLALLLPKFGIAGAAIAWSVRAAFDLSLFLACPPPRREIAALGAATLIVAASVATALILAFTSATYWTAMLALLSLALVLGWRLVSDELGTFRAMVYRRFFQS